MKTILPVLIAGFLAINFSAKAQTCYVIRDSVVAGENSTAISDYVYGAGNRLEQVTHKDSGSTQVNRAELVLYVNATDISEIRSFTTIGSSDVYRTVKYTYTSGKISRVEVMDSSSALWMVAHDITYSGNNIASIEVDPSSIVGSPEMIQQASFIDFVWANGNITSLSLVLGGDTLELVTTSDNYNNIFKKRLNTEGAAFIFQAASQNNFETISLLNNEPGFGLSQGTKILDRAYTYEGNGDVRTMVESPTPLNQNSQTIRYLYDCSVGIQREPATSIVIYPNPAINIISIENNVFHGEVKIFDIAGKQVFRNDIQNSTTLDISNLTKGIYTLEMINDEKVFRGKFLVNQ